MKLINKLLISLFILISLFSCATKQEIVEENNEEIDKEETIVEKVINAISGNIDKPIERTATYSVSVNDDGYVIYNSNQSVGYNYGPSIIKNEDGSYDAWFSSPGNNGSQWDYIRYRHSDDGIEWSDPEIVLRPTNYSDDECSVCDPGVIYVDGYYYIAYTGTSDRTNAGYNNSIFVARSEYPDGPYEKWNGSSWGGKPKAIISYQGDPSSWGYGEPSFVIKDDDLFIYYSYKTADIVYIDLYKADLVEDWPLTMRHKDFVCPMDYHDSVDFVYDENLDTFFAFSIDYPRSSISSLIVYESKDGKNYVEIANQKSDIEEYAHNLGISKSLEGHINTNNDLLIGYAYGENWGKWSTMLQTINIASIYK